MNKRQQKAVTPRVWVHNPPLDLIVGCGAWSTPLLLLAYSSGLSSTMAWAVALYVLALFFNYPHYMATIYRAYHTSEDFNKYRVFTVHITALVLATVLISHLYPNLLPWIFTLYLTWSPWHYSGQNYGLFMMFARRAGASPTPLQRQALYAAFLVSYLMLFVSMHSGPSNDPLFLSLGIPDVVMRVATVALGIFFTVAIVYGISGLLQQIGVKKLMPALTLLSTQCLWFLMPGLLWVAEGWHLPASRYSTGVLAIMHSAQYLWITSYYARREATDERSGKWRPFAYGGVLVAGGIALFIPGPWVASYIFHYDFTTSFLIFTAIVNIHHFILDGAIWKLRDGRIAALLLNSPQQVATGARGAGDWISSKARWAAGNSTPARALRISLALLLLGLAGLDRFRFLLSTGEGTVARAERAAALNPYDGTAQMRLATLEWRAGQQDAAVQAWKRAFRERPFDPAPRNALLQYLTDKHRFQEAYELAHDSLQRTPRDADLWVNYGILSEKLDHPEEAQASWRKALRIDPRQGRAHLYIATSLDHQGKYDDAIPQYVMFLDQVAHSGIEKRPPAREIVGVVVHLADCQVHAGRNDDALRSFDLARRIAVQSGDVQLQSLTDVREADLQVKQGSAKAARSLYQDALRLDASSNDSRSAAVDWYNYGLLLRQQGYPERLVYACLWKAHTLLPEGDGPEAKVLNLELSKMAGPRKTIPASSDLKDAVEQALQAK